MIYAMRFRSLSDVAFNDYMLLLL